MVQFRGAQPPLNGQVMPPQQSGLPGTPGGAPPMGQPAIPPEWQAKIEGLKRSAASIKLLRNERLRGFRVDIEVDSTIYGDAQQEKGDRTQFLTAITGFLQQALQMSAQVPEIAPLMGKFLQFGVRGFRVGRDLESAIEEFCDEAVILAKQKEQQAKAQPNPQQLVAQAQVMKAKAQVASVQSKDQNEKAKLQLHAQTTQQKNAADQQRDNAEIQRQTLQNQGEQADNAAEIQGKGIDVKMKEMELQLEQMKLNFQAMKMSHEAMKPMQEIAEGAE